MATLPPDIILYSLQGFPVEAHIGVSNGVIEGPSQVCSKSFPRGTEIQKILVEILYVVVCDGVNFKALNPVTLFVGRDPPNLLSGPRLKTIGSHTYRYALPLDA